VALIVAFIRAGLPGLARAAANCAEASQSRTSQWRRNVTTELFNEIHADASMDSAMAAQDFCFVVQWYGGRVPDVRMDVEAPGPVALERDELFGCDLVPG